MSSSLTPTSQLEAVNQMLFAIGESPVNSIEDSGLVDAVTAVATLNNVSREVQSIGWHWNTEIRFRLVPDTDGNLLVPANTLKIDTVDEDEGLDVVLRGKRLYDRVNHNYTFTRSVLTEIVVYLAFDELPEPARNYIALRAARRFQQNSVGSQELSGFQQGDELRALVALQNAEAETGDYTMLNGSWSVGRVMAR